MDIYLYNTLTRKKEVFKPIKKGHVGIYSCGPTLYWYQHVGNFRTTLLSDFLKRDTPKEDKFRQYIFEMKKRKI